MFTVIFWGLVGFFVSYFGIYKPMIWFKKRKEATEYNRQCRDLGHAIFWLSETEKEQFVTLHNKIGRLEQIMADAEREAEEGGVVKNMDGSFSARSDLGKRLRKIVDTTWPLLENAKKFYSQLESAPRDRCRYFEKRCQESCGWVYNMKGEKIPRVTLENLNAYSIPKQLPTRPAFFSRNPLGDNINIEGDIFSRNSWYSILQDIRDGKDEQKQSLPDLLKELEKI